MYSNQKSKGRFGIRIKFPFQWHQVFKNGPREPERMLVEAATPFLDKKLNIWGAVPASGATDLRFETQCCEITDKCAKIHNNLRWSR